MRLRWLPLALQDLDRIRRYIALDNPRAARRWVERLRIRAKAAAAAPMSGRVVPESERDDVREVFLRSYRIVYRVLDEEIHVVTVFEGHRLLLAHALDAEDE
jgi:toxin ParE1/3/4